MKLNKIFAAGVVAALAMSLVACGSAASSSSVAASTAASSAAASSVAASSAAASTAASAVEESRDYTLQSACSTDITELYVYKTGDSSKGDNLAKTALKSGDTVNVTVTGYTKEAAGEDKATAYTIEFVAGGTTYSFTTLHVEDLTGPIYLLGTDAATGATAISFMAPAASSAAAK